MEAYKLRTTAKAVFVHLVIIVNRVFREVFC